MDSSKWRDQASTRARSELSSLLSGSSFKAARSVAAARVKSLWSLDSRARRRASSESLTGVRGGSERANARGAGARRNMLATMSRERSPAWGLVPLGVEIRFFSLITGIHSLEGFPHVARGLLDAL